MNSVSDSDRSSATKHSVSQEELAGLLQFFSPAGEGVSFYLGWPDVPNNAHRLEEIALKDLLRGAAHSSSGEMPTGIAADLKKIRGRLEGVRSDANKLHVVFACHGEGLWHDFELPCRSPWNIGEVGQYLRVAPLMSAVQRTSPYGVVLVEFGKARAFVVHGAESKEIAGAIASTDLSIHVDDARVGWSGHIDSNLNDRKRAFLKHLAERIQEFTKSEGLESLIVGCRKDLWSELEPQFENTGRLRMATFHLPNFEMGGAEVVRHAEPLFLSLEKERIDNALHRVKENPRASAVGTDEVLALLAEGNVSLIVLGAMADEVVTECRSCNRMTVGTPSKCSLCGGTYMGHLPANEAILRKAVACGAEVLFADSAQVTFNGVAALLRH
jgi:hypothetical protein